MRYIIGIDLGTTNSSVAYVDTQSENLSLQQFRVPQLIAPGYFESLPTLPSFCYICGEGEWTKNDLLLPWKDSQNFIVGKLAQLHGAKVPTRLVQSAKSWLCHAAANRREKILPFEMTDTASRISPVEASARYLSHIKEAWNALIAKEDHTREFEQQEIILTVPASFDEISRRLTVEAASQAGLIQMTLLEEPQAAFYSWISQHETTWQYKLKPGALVLVCDVGGGTTDFSLIEVKGTAEKPVLQRMAVGDHLLLGGDNIDAALAHYIENRVFPNEEPSPLQWMQLKAEARLAKEALLSDKNPASLYRITLQGAGSSVIKNSFSADVTENDVLTAVLEGFFCIYPWDEALKLRKTMGIRAMGLPYEDEPSITKHLAHFLNQSSGNVRPSKGPDFVLFNGGTMKPKLFQEAIINSLKTWFPDQSPEKLTSFHLDLAVARGAVYYGKARRGYGTKILGGSARAYYLGIDVQQADGNILPQALTLLPRGVDEGASFEPSHTFYLRPNMAISFQIYTSHVRLKDQSGDLITIDSEQLQPLPPLLTLLRFGKNKLTEQGNDTNQLIPVHLFVQLNAIGVLELSLKSQKTEHMWNLEFQLRTAEGQENILSSLSKERKDEFVDQNLLQKGKEEILAVFSNDKQATKPERVMESLESLLEQSRREWSPALLRGLSESLAVSSDKRKLSQAHTVRWWNLTGFLLRPGIGYPLDDFRMKELWKIILSDAKEKNTSEIQVQKWICFRRVCAGFNKGQQLQLAHDLFASLLDKRTGKLVLPLKGEMYAYSEKLRTLASMELIDLSMKKKLGDFLIERINTGKATSVEYWALGRIGSRILLYGLQQHVVPKEICEKWVETLLRLPLSQPNNDLEVLLSQLARKTDCREINLSQIVIDSILTRFSYSPSLKNILSESHEMTPQEQDLLFGEQLPPGLMLYIN